MEERIVINKSEVVDKFSNVRIMTEDEKKEYIKSKKLINRPSIFFIIVTLGVYSLAAYFLYIAVVAIKMRLSILIPIALMFTAACVCYVASITSRGILHDKKLREKIMSQDMYIVECNLCEKKRDSEYGDSAKVYDGKYIVDTRYSISRELYNNENPKAHIYVLDRYGSDIFEIF